MSLTIALPTEKEYLVHFRAIWFNMYKAGHFCAMRSAHTTSLFDNWPDFKGSQVSRSV